MKKEMDIDKETGLLNIAQFIPSPNFDLRPIPMLIDLLVIHNISLPPGKFGGEAIDQLFLNQLNHADHPFYQGLVDLKVSAHLLIRRQGDIKQFVPFHLRAWHAGESFFEGRTRCNDFSIGIELEGTDDIPYTTAQYRQLSLVTKQLIKSYPSMSLDRIVGHQTIAPTRKTDPGPAFNWDYFYELLKKEF